MAPETIAAERDLGLTILACIAAAIAVNWIAWCAWEKAKTLWSRGGTLHLPGGGRIEVIPPEEKKK